MIHSTTNRKCLPFLIPTHWSWNHAMQRLHWVILVWVLTLQFAASAFRKLSSIYVFSYFPFGFEGRIWDLIVSVPDHCLSFYFPDRVFQHYPRVLWSSVCLLLLVLVSRFSAGRFACLSCICLSRLAAHSSFFDCNAFVAGVGCVELWWRKSGI